MKIRRIKNENELIAGPYIWAVINCYGDFWVTHIWVKGKPFTCRSKHCGKARKIKTNQNSGSASHYLSDLGVGGTDMFSSRLIPFSSKVWQHLVDIEDVRTFARAITGIPHSDLDFASCEYEWDSLLRDDEKWRRL